MAAAVCNPGRRLVQHVVERMSRSLFVTSRAWMWVVVVRRRFCSGARGAREGLTCRDVGRRGLSTLCLLIEDDVTGGMEIRQLDMGLMSQWVGSEIDEVADSSHECSNTVRQRFAKLLQPATAANIPTRPPLSPIRVCKLQRKASEQAITRWTLDGCCNITCSCLALEEAPIMHHLLRRSWCTAPCTKRTR